MRPYFLLTASVLGFASGATSSYAETAYLDVLETTDIHMNLVDYDYFLDEQSNTVGLSKVATLIKNARAQYQNVLLVDNGDLLQGSPLGDYMARIDKLENGEIHPAYKAMNLMGYDVGNIGNHEFNFGLDFLMKSVEGAKFPYISSNLYLDDGDQDPANDQHVFKPYLLVDKEITLEDGSKQTIKVGFLGFVPPQIMTWDARNLTGKVKPADIVETAEKFVAELEAQGADLIIAIPHSGISPTPKVGMDENASYYLTDIKGIDGIMFGHSHGVFPSDKFQDFPDTDLVKGTIKGVPAVMPGFWGSHLGHIRYTLDYDAEAGWRIADTQAEVLPIYKREDKEVVSLVDADSEINAAIAQEHEKTIEYMGQNLGEITAPVNSYFALVQDDPSIQIVNQAQIAYVKEIIQGTEYDGLPVLSAMAPFKAGGRMGADYYTDIAKGPIALRNVADLYIYPNTLHVVKMTGQEVQEWLEKSAVVFLQIDPKKSEPQPLIDPKIATYNFDVIDGVTYEIDLTKPARYDADGNLVDPSYTRIQNLAYEGKPIDLTAEFLVATNNYRATGGGHFPGLDGKRTVIEAPDENRTVLANYFQTQNTIDPKADGNWKFVDNLDQSVAIFTTSAKAQDLVSTTPFTLVRDLGDGFLELKLSTK